MLKPLVALALLMGIAMPLISQKGPMVTIEGVKQNDKNASVTLMICRVYHGKFNDCVLAGGVTLDDIAFWQGYSAEMLGTIYKQQRAQIAQLKRQLRRAKIHEHTAGGKQ